MTFDGANHAQSCSCFRSRSERYIAHPLNIEAFTPESSLSIAQHWIFMHFFSQAAAPWLPNDSPTSETFGHHPASDMDILLHHHFPVCPFALGTHRSHHHTTTAAASITFLVVGSGIFCAAGPCGLTTWWIWWHLLVIPPNFTYNVIECVVDVDPRLGRRFDIRTIESTG